jgi:adenylosuccinate lyase
MIDRYSRDQMKKVWSENNKYDKWLEVEISVCQAWHKQGVIPKSDIDKLEKCNYDFDKLNDILKVTRHEMTAFLQSITDVIGPEGRWLHLGLTTSDVWDTATSLQLIDAADILLEDVAILLDTLKIQALKYKNTLMVGRTHGVHAEPITFGLKLALWWDEMRRNQNRLIQAKEEISVGKISGPVGTFATVNPELENFVCTKLGISPAPVSNQIIQRDRHARFLTTLAVIAASLEKIATEIRNLQRTEIREVSEPFPKGQPGSSSMPHKRNPELSERICGISRLIRGNSMAALENVALWSERDISHSSVERIILPDSCLALDYALFITNQIIKDLNVNVERMEYNLEMTKGVLFSQRVLLAMIEKGFAREKAYSIVHDLSMNSWNENKDFRDLVRNNQIITSTLQSDEIEDLFNYKYYVRYVDEVFSRLNF